jgi:hypothetical protein
MRHGVGADDMTVTSKLSNLIIRHHQRAQRFRRRALQGLLNSDDELFLRFTDKLAAVVAG